MESIALDIALNPDQEIDHANKKLDWVGLCTYSIHNHIREEKGLIH